MNELHLIRRSLRCLVVVAFGAATMAAFAQGGPEGPGPQDLRAKAKDLQREARELKAQGEQDKAREAMEKAEKLVDKAARMEQESKGGVKDQEKSRDQTEDQTLKRLLQRRETERGETGNREQRRVEIERRIERLPGEFRSSPRPLAPLSEQDIRPWRRGQGLMPEAPGLPERQRMRHLQAAIENLRAAGMPGAAERLARLAERMRPRFERGSQPGAPLPPMPPAAPAPRRERGPRFEQGMPGGAPMEGGLRQLRQQVQELRQAVQELRRHIEETNAERR